MSYVPTYDSIKRDVLRSYVCFYKKAVIEISFEYTEK